MTSQTIDGVPRRLLVEAMWALDNAGIFSTATALRALLDAPADTRTETVPKHKFDTLVQHCKRLDGEIAQARAHVNEITLYQQNAVWFWQHDGEDFLESLSCPIIIQPHHLRELLKGVAPATQPQGEPVAWQYMTHPTWDRGAWPTEWTDCTKEAHDDYVRAPMVADWEYRTRKLYAEQPAPVAVVLPGRKQHVHQGLSHTDAKADGFNACLDEVTRLNTK
jgi:hypothetical protein